MKKIVSFLLVLALVFGASATLNIQTTNAGYVNGYYRSNGTYVNGYYRNTSSARYKRTSSFSYPTYSSYSYTPSYSSYSYTPSYSSYSYTPSYSSYSYTPSYSIRSYPSYRPGLKYQNGYFKPSTGTYVQGYYKTYSDGNLYNNRYNLFGY